MGLQKVWSQQQDLHRLPIMCQLARKVLGAPCSSIYSERLFSEFGDVYEAKRSRLLPVTGENLLFLHHTYQRLEKNEDASEDNVTIPKPSAISL